MVSQLRDMDCIFGNLIDEFVTSVVNSVNQFIFIPLVSMRKIAYQRQPETDSQVWPAAFADYKKSLYILLCPEMPLL